MNSICNKKAEELFYSSNARLVFQEQSKIYYDDFSEDCDLKCYLSNDCLVTYVASFWHIHALSEKSDILSVICEVKKKMNPGESLMVSTLKTIPKELEGKKGSLKFARKYSTYEDENIRELKKGDLQSVLTCCEEDKCDNRYGKSVSSSFYNNFEDCCESGQNLYLGLFEGDKLSGIVSKEMIRMNLYTIEIFVNRQYRGKGYGKRLLSAICASSPDTDYCYSCEKQNIASIATATSCGFVFQGVYVLI